jgi:hypothetical protein
MSEWHKRLLGALAGLSLLVGVIVAVGWREVPATLANLPATLNPEDASHFNPVAFVNDTPGSVEFGMCEDTCDDLYFDEELAPGERSDVQQVSNEDLSTSVLVRQRGRAARCLTIRLTKPRDETLTVSLSAARPCGDLLSDD